MTEDERLERLLREAMPATTAPGSPRDLWPLIVARGRTPGGWSWLDLGIAAVVAIALLMRPGWLWLLAYHL
jgi:hypothetical protein